MWWKVDLFPETSYHLWRCACKTHYCDSDGHWTCPFTPEEIAKRPEVPDRNVDKTAEEMRPSYRTGA
jgi:hypothetical protein